MSSAKFQDKSYQQHSNHYKEFVESGEKATQAKTWFETDTVDAWRHHRLFRALDPILQADPNSRWVTVGDGRYGKDARYLIDNGAEAVATDICEHLLKEAAQKGFIKEYKVENAERLSFCDEEFDYAFCKESYHHFPRPMIALYEMLRVSKRGVVFIEPSDPYMIRRYTEIPIRILKTIVKSLQGKESVTHAFEEAGNYVFTLSRREIEKVALGLNYKTVAFKGVNDSYYPGGEFEKLSEKGTVYKKTSRSLSFKDLLCKMGLLDYGYLTAVIFKKDVSRDLYDGLIKEGYDVIRLPDNPYIEG